jgi:CRISPR/Cas system-associated exonuclease Cas4 (RecB family)
MVDAEPTEQMILGKEAHEQLYQEFLVDAKPSSVKRMIKKSRKTELLSREFSVVSENFGIVGNIDEVVMSPESFVIIDDKPGRVAYPSNKNQVFAYCLAFDDYISQWRAADDDRPIVAALRQRGTQEIIWKSIFNDSSQKMIVREIDRMHSLMQGKLAFSITDNKNRCFSCDVREYCDRC